MSKTIRKQVSQSEIPGKLVLVTTACLLSFTFTLGLPSFAEDDSQPSYTEDDQGNRHYIQDDGSIKTVKAPPKPQPSVAPASPEPPPKKGQPVTLPNGSDAYRAGDGSIRYMDPNGNVMTVKPNGKGSDGHTIIQNLLNGINAITNEGGGSAYTLPGVGNFAVDPYGRMTQTPWFNWNPNDGFSPGLDSIPNLTHNTNVDPYTNGGMPVTTYTYTDPNTGSKTTISEGQQTKGGGSATVITDPNGNKIVNTTNMGTHIYGPNGKAISNAAGEGHRHGPGGTEIPNILFFPKATGLKNQVQPAPMKSSPDKGDQGMYMKSYDNDVEPESAQPAKPGHTSKVKITAKQSGPFRITAEVEQPTDPGTSQPMGATGGGTDQ
jgi:hypothetical protein